MSVKVITRLNKLITDNFMKTIYGDESYDCLSYCFINSALELLIEKPQSSNEINKRNCVANDVRNKITNDMRQKWKSMIDDFNNTNEVITKIKNAETYLKKYAFEEEYRKCMISMFNSIVQDIKEVMTKDELNWKNLYRNIKDIVYESYYLDSDLSKHGKAVIYRIMDELIDCYNIEGNSEESCLLLYSKLCKVRKYLNKA